MKRKRFNLPYKLISGIFIFLLLTALSLGFLIKSFRNSELFSIKKIFSRYGDVADLGYLAGRNIFSVNLAKESQSILARYPAYEKVRLVRILPDEIFVDFVKRRPIALVRLNRYFCVDVNNVLFDALNLQNAPELPFIVGLERSIVRPCAGTRYNIKGLTLAVDIIKELKARKAFNDHKVKKIDILDTNNASFFLLASSKQLVYTKNPRATGGIELLEIKLGADNTKDKIRVLADLISSIKGDLSDIKYIDLRFKEPVIKFKGKNAE